ncbi:MAG: hypothetical protein ABIK96_08280 [bacterium]
MPAVSSPSSAAPRDHTRPGGLDRLLEIGLLLAAVVGRLPALGSWWTLDDWGQLARAAGIGPAAEGLPARWLSQHAWWSLAWPLAGLDPDPQTLARILLHGAGAVLVARIGRRTGLPRVSWFLAGLVFVATPLAFTPLYWASGIQELLGAFFALLAVDRWLAGGRANLGLALGAALLSMLAKENGLGLPLLFIALLWFGTVGIQDRPFAWAMTMFMLLFAVSEGALVMAHFATGETDPYALGGGAVILSNLGSFGWWLLTPGPVFASRLSWLMGAAGAAFFLLWGLWAWAMARGGRLLPAGTFLAALLVLGPALPLRTQIHPYLAYLAAAPLGLALGCLVPSRLKPGRAVPAGMLVLAVAWSFFGMRIRLANRNELGFPADPVVRATSLSWQTTRTVRQWTGGEAGTGPAPAASLVFLQVPVQGRAVEDAARFGPRWVKESEIHRACGGSVGPLLSGPPGLEVAWRNSLEGAPPDALVLTETATGFNVWGRTPNAVLYAALTDLALGHFERARRHLLLAARLHPDTVNFTFDEGQMIVPLDLAVENLPRFVDWSVQQLDNGASRFEVGGLQDLIFDLVSVASGRPVRELRQGSRIMIPGSDGELRQASPDTSPGKER